HDPWIARLLIASVVILFVILFIPIMPRRLILAPGGCLVALLGVATLVRAVRTGVRRRGVGAPPPRGGPGAGGEGGPCGRGGRRQRGGGVVAGRDDGRAAAAPLGTAAFADGAVGRRLGRRAAGARRRRAGAARAGGALARERTHRARVGGGVRAADPRPDG